MSQKFILFISQLRDRLYTILADLWGVGVLLTISCLLRSKESSNSISCFFSKEKFLSMLEYWTECEGTRSMVINVAITTLSITFFLSFLFSLLFFSLHLYFPVYFKITSYVFLPFSIFYLSNPFDNYKARIFLTLLSLIFSIYEIFKTSFNFDYSAYDFSRKNLKIILKQKFIFYFKLAAQLPLLLIDVFCLRLIELSGFNDIKIFFLLPYVLTFVYSNSYSLGSNLTIYYADVLMPSNIDESVNIDFIYCYFNSRCFAIFRVITLCISIPTRLYYIYRYKAFIYLYDFENPEISSYLCALKKQSFVKHVFYSNQKFWYTGLKRKINQYNFREDMFASMTISWILIYSVIRKFQNNFIRSYESFIIVFIHFNIIIEIFNSFVFVSTFKSNYGQNHYISETTEEPSKDLLSNEVKFIPITNCEYLP